MPASTVIVRSSVSDKYDRYLADIFIPKAENLILRRMFYLNSVLLESGRAGRMS